MLGDDAVNKTVPLILCAEENVEGTHGATIGELDDDTLLLLRAAAASTAKLAEKHAFARGDCPSCGAAGEKRNGARGDTRTNWTGKCDRIATDYRRDFPLLMQETAAVSRQRGDGAAPAVRAWTRKKTFYETPERQSPARAVSS